MCFGGSNWAKKGLPTSWHVRLIYRTGLDHEAAEQRTNTWQRCAWEHSLGEWLLPGHWRGLLQEEDKPVSYLSPCFYLPVWTCALRLHTCLLDLGRTFTTFHFKVKKCFCTSAILERGTQSHRPETLWQQPFFTYLLVVRCTVSAVFAPALHPAAAPGVDSGAAPHYGTPYPGHTGLQASPSVDPSPSEQLPEPVTGRTHCYLSSLQLQVHDGTQEVCFHLYLRGTGDEIPYISLHRFFCFSLPPTLGYSLVNKYHREAKSEPQSSKENILKKGYTEPKRFLVPS